MKTCLWGAVNGCRDRSAGTAICPKGQSLESAPVGRDISVRLVEDKPGELGRVVQALTRSGVNIEGLAEVEGVVHILARDPRAARQALRGGGFAIDSELEVLIVPMPDRQGEVAMILQRLQDADVNVKFLYLATDTRVVIGTDDIAAAREALGPGKN